MSTRLHRHELLEHPARDAIAQLIEETPGIAFLELFERLRTVPAFSTTLGNGSLSYHLQCLERFGLITTRKAGRYRRHYLNGCEAIQGHATRLALLQTRPVDELARIVLSHPGLSQRDAWQRFQERRVVSRQAVGYHLQRLEAAGLVTVVRRGCAKLYFGTEIAAQLLRLVTPNPGPCAEPMGILEGPLTA